MVGILERIVEIDLHPTGTTCFFLDLRLVCQILLQHLGPRSLGRLTNGTSMRVQKVHTIMVEFLVKVAHLIRREHLSIVRLDSLALGSVG